MTAEPALSSRQLEEFKEAGLEYRYRDQLMVQEFGLSMGVAGVLIGAASSREGRVEGLVIQVFGLAFLFLLTLHLRNTNEDRLEALSRRDALRTAMEFAPIHRNVGGKRRASAPALMVWFSGSATVAWALWTLSPLLPLLRSLPLLLHINP
jgi:hypothetical protein